MCIREHFCSGFATYYLYLICLYDMFCAKVASAVEFGYTIPCNSAPFDEVIVVVIYSNVCLTVKDLVSVRVQTSLVFLVEMLFLGCVYTRADYCVVSEKPTLSFLSPYSTSGYV